jgi:hypothetical protein
MISSDILGEHGMQLQEPEKALQAAGPLRNACMNCTCSRSEQWSAYVQHQTTKQQVNGPVHPCHKIAACR